MKESCHAHDWVMSHIRMHHVTHRTESHHIHDWIMSHIRWSHVTHRKESCTTYDWVTSHIWLSRITPMTESCHTYDWVTSHLWWSHATYMSQVWLRHVTHMTESCYTYKWVMSHIWLSYVTHMTESCQQLHPDAVQAIVEYHYLGKVTINGLDALLALAAAVHELQVWFWCVTWLFYLWNTTHSRKGDYQRPWFLSCSRCCRPRTTAVDMTRCMCDTAHSYVWRDAFKNVTWLNSLVALAAAVHELQMWFWCVISLFYLWNTAFHVCDMTFRCVTWLEL